LPPGQRIGERVDRQGRPDPLQPATIARIEAGLARYARPLLAPAGGTWRDTASPVDQPMPTRTTRDNDALVVPPLMVQVSQRAALTATGVGEPLRTQTCRRETGLVIPPYLVTLRGGGSKTTAHGVDEPLATVSAQGNHHGLVGPPANRDEENLLVSYHSTGSAHPTASQPIGTLTTRDRYALLSGTPPVQACTFRMLEPHEIAAGMAFAPGYKVKGSKRDRVRGFGNACRWEVGNEPAPH
jgi:DNA (cytosine-5)-methyltransferase 1